jgi:hypothetical protein
MSDNLDEMQKTYGRRSLRRFIPSKRTVKWTVLIILVLLILGYIGLHIWLDIWFTEKIERRYSKKYIDSIQSLMETTIDFPEEWLQEPEKYYLADQYQELKESCEIFDKENKSLSAKFLEWRGLINSPGGLTQDEWKELGNDLQQAEKFLHVGLKVSREMDHQISAMKPEDRFTIASSDVWSRYNYCQIAKVYAAYLIYSNKIEDGVDYLISMESYAVSNPVLNYTRYQIIPNELKSHISNIDSKQHLRDWLDTLNNFYPFLFTHDYENAPIYALLSQLNAHKRNGRQIDMTPGRKGAYYMRQIDDYRRHPKSDWEGMKSSIDSIIQHILSGGKIQHWHQGNTRMIISLFRSITFSSKLELYCQLQTFELPNPTDIMKDEPNLESKYNELRLTIAGRLYMLENNVYPKSTVQLIPEYLPNDVKDVVTGRSYVWDENGNLKTIK